MFLPINYKSCIQYFTSLTIILQSRTDVFRLISYLPGGHRFPLISVHCENHFAGTWNMLPFFFKVMLLQLQAAFFKLFLDDVFTFQGHSILGLLRIEVELLKFHWQCAMLSKSKKQESKQAIINAVKGIRLPFGSLLSNRRCWSTLEHICRESLCF